MENLVVPDVHREHSMLRGTIIKYIEDLLIIDQLNAQILVL